MKKRPSERPKSPPKRPKKRPPKRPKFATETAAQKSAETAQKSAEKSPKKLHKNAQKFVSIFFLRTNSVSRTNHFYFSVRNSHFHCQLEGCSVKRGQGREILQKGAGRFCKKGSKSKTKLSRRRPILGKKNFPGKGSFWELKKNYTGNFVLI